ncbi:MAG: chemotaxis protein CheA [Sulfuriflexus sp.]|nr:chemotaxis protein CheA [Sulfuriflexus sp.]
MAFDGDDEILQDFLVEAGEILDDLGNQLVDLENASDDPELLNAVFRGFHTIKGGASFLSLDSLVALCHLAEDVFNALRNGEREVDAQLMDVMLPVLDSLNDMFESLRDGEEPDAADPAQLAALNALLGNETAAVEAAPVVEETPTPTTAEPSADALEDEFEAILAASAGGKAPEKTEEASASDSSEISDDEFEAMLDQMHGKGNVPSNSAPVEPEKPAANASGSDEPISDDEFDNILNDLHGAGVVPGGNSDAAEKTAEPVAKAPEPVVEAPKPEPAAKKAPAKKRDAAPQAEATVRVDTRRLDDIMNLVGELVLVRNRLTTLQAKVDDEDVSHAVTNLDVITADLQNSVMKTRMQPIKKVFGRFPRVIRDLARALSKDIKLDMEGEDTDLDKNLVEALADPLVHLVRNAVDHGIEMPDDREAAGKPRTGTVLLKASQEGDHIELSISDDGKGMDPDILRGIAVKKGLMDEDAAARLSDLECYNLIFAAGFSTKEEISDISGRGVGMDVVKTRIIQLNGSVEIDSKLGEGSVLTIKVPLTLAIMPTLMVILGQQTFALPLVNVCEIFDLDLSQMNVVDGQKVIVVRDKPVSLYFLRDWLAKNPAPREDSDSSHVVIVALGTQRLGFVVDELLGQEEVVIKPLGEMLLGTPGMSGATITGDGKIALIIDVPGLLKAYAHRM